MKKLIGILVSLALMLSLSSLAFAEETTAKEEKTKAAVPQEIKDGKEQLRKLFEEAKSIREKLKATRGEVKKGIEDIKESLDDLSEEEKAEMKEDLTALKDSLKSDRSGVKAIRDLLISMTEQMKAYRTQLKEAVSGKDYSGAAVILDNMIKLKTEKNAELNKLLELRESMVEKVNN